MYNNDMDFSPSYSNGAPIAFNTPLTPVGKKEVVADIFNLYNHLSFSEQVDLIRELITANNNQVNIRKAELQKELQSIEELEKARRDLSQLMNKQG